MKSRKRKQSKFKEATRDHDLKSPASHFVDGIGQNQTSADRVERIMLAVSKRNTSVVKNLAPFYTAKELGRLLHISAAQDDAETLKILLRFKPNLNFKDEDGRTPLHWAAQQNSLSSAKMLIKNGAK